MRKMVKNVCKFVKKHSSIILTSGAITAVIASTCMSVKAGFETHRILDELKKENPEATKKEKIKAVKKEYVPVVIADAVTIGCIIALYSTNKKKEAALMAACSMFQHRLTQFKEDAEEIEPGIVEEVDKKHQHEILKNEEIFKTEIHHGEEILAFDSVSERYFYTSLHDLASEKYQINRYFKLNGCMSANDYFMFLGIPETDWGDSVGWDEYIGECHYGYTWIDINIIEEELTDGLVVYKIEVPFQPHDDYLDPENLLGD